MTTPNGEDIMRRTVTVAACTLAALTIAGTAQAATYSSLTLDQPNPANGDAVTFTATLPKSAKNTVLIVGCFQNQRMVYEQRGTVTDAYTLTWGSGPAHCDANVYNLVWRRGQWDYMALAVTSFDATG